MWSSSSRRAAVLALGVALIVPAAHAEPTPADKEKARDLYIAGMELRDAGKHSAALKKFKAAYAILPTPITGLAVGAAYETLENWVEARAAYVEAAALPPKPNESKESKTAREQATKNVARLTQRLGTLTLTVSGLPAGKEFTVLVDGHELPVERYAEGIVVLPGAHRVTVRAASRGEQTVTVTVAAGETRSVMVSLAELTDDPGPSEKPVETTAATTTTNSLVYWGFGAAVIGVGVTGLAYSRFRTLGAYLESDSCRHTGNDCPEQRSEQKTWGTTFSWVGLPLTFAGLGVGIYGLATPTKSEPSKRVSGALGIRLVAAGSMLLLRGEF